MMKNIFSWLSLLLVLLVISACGSASHNKTTDTEKSGSTLLTKESVITDGTTLLVGSDFITTDKPDNTDNNPATSAIGTKEPAVTSEPVSSTPEKDPIKYPIDSNAISDIMRLAGVPDNRLFYPERELSDEERTKLTAILSQKYISSFFVTPTFFDPQDADLYYFMYALTSGSWENCVDPESEEYTEVIEKIGNRSLYGSDCFKVPSKLLKTLVEQYLGIPFEGRIKDGIEECYFEKYDAYYCFHSDSLIADDFSAGYAAFADNSGRIVVYLDNLYGADKMSDISAIVVFAPNENGDYFIRTSISYYVKNNRVEFTDRDVYFPGYGKNEPTDEKIYPFNEKNISEVMKSLGAPEDKIFTSYEALSGEELEKVKTFLNKSEVIHLLSSSVFYSPEDIDLFQVIESMQPNYLSLSEEEKKTIAGKFYPDNNPEYIEFTKITSAELDDLTRTYLGIPFEGKIAEKLNEYYVEKYDAYYLFMCPGLDHMISLKTDNIKAYSDKSGRIIVFEPRLDYGYYGTRTSAITVLIPFEDAYRIDMSINYYFTNGEICLSKFSAERKSAE